MQAARETLIFFSSFHFSPGCSQMRSEVKLVLGGKKKKKKKEEKELPSYFSSLLTFARDP